MTFTVCHLHIPYKDWMLDQEKDNYLTIERWTRDFYAHFLAGFRSGFQNIDIPNKNWAGSGPGGELEHQNYLEFERWARLLPGLVGLFISSDTAHDLHFPHKNWALQDKRDDVRNSGHLEIENYLAIERWARKFIRTCLPTGNH